MSTTPAPIFPELPRLEQAARLPKAFVVGCQKSGTTWLQILLATHPEVCMRGEACFGNFLKPIVGNALQAYNQTQRAGKVNTFAAAGFTAVTRAAVLSLYCRWLDAEPNPDAIQLLAEKTPEHALSLDVLSGLFPACRVVHIIRDGRDGVVSGWHHGLRENADTFRARFPSLTEYAEYFATQHWVPYIESARAWGAQRPAQYHELRYEEIHENPRAQAQSIFAFLGVDSSPETVGACVERASFKQVSGGRGAGQEDNASHFRKGIVGDWQESLDPDSVAAFERVGGALMDRLGYPRAAPAA